MEKENIPECVGFILDGNRRWAKSKGLQTLEGHSRGLEAFQNIIEVVHEQHIPHMVAYVFSTENWNRSMEEVNYLMTLFRKAFNKLIEQINQNDKKIHIRFIGQLERLPKDLQKQIADIKLKQSSEIPELTVWVAISYGGRAEIIDAVNRAIDGGVYLDEKGFKNLMWTKDMPDPDIIIRTSGEQRLSNFLLWQSAYSELFFTDTLWPDFGREEFQSILDEYAGRQRRNGK